MYVQPEPSFKKVSKGDHFPNFATGDEKVDTMERRGTPCLMNFG